MSRSAQPFGRYELLERISAGGMAEVFRATDKAKNHIVALKRILPQIAEDEEFVQMFEDEARIASQLEHPHIARMLDFGRIDDSYYIAFEYVNGRDLRALFDRCVRMGEFPPLPFLLYTFARIGEGLAYAHARRDDNGQPQSIVHRDVSPQNIMVSFDGDVKLIDFGIAKAAGKLSRTQVGTLKGKFGYMAPEQIRGTEIDHRTDLFSLGICMWELLTLERLFYAENELLVLEKVRSATIAPPSTKNRDVPPELDRIVLKALAKDVRERYGAAKDVYRDLDKLAKSIEGTATREDIARYMRRAFPESLARRPTPSDVGPVNRNTARERVNQESTMAADIPSSDKSRGSDLDIFEGLGKKASAAPSRASSVPPPPRSSVPNPPMIIKNDMAKKTLVGIAPAGVSAAQAQVVAAQAAAGGAVRIATPPPRTAPPPPPGRGSLPQVVPPPPRASVLPPPAPLPSPSKAPPAPAAAAPPPAAAPAAGGSASPTRASAMPPGAATPKAHLDMDWDDEDEATHVFDKAPTMDEPATDRPPRPAAGTPLAPPVSTQKGGLGAPSIPPPPPSRQSATPPPPPSRQSATPPPPPSSLNAFARTSAAPPPPPQFPAPTNAPATMPSHAAPAMPAQVNTAPMPMPGRSAPPPPNAQGGFLNSGPALPPVTGAPTLGNRMEATQLVRPKEASKAPMIGAAIAIASIAFGIVVFVMMPRTGRIAVNVADTKGVTLNRVEIFVDGKKQCETAPCIVDQVSAGSHEVKVLAQGYDTPFDRTVAVEGRKDATLDYSLTSTGAQAGTGIKVSGSQPGVKLYVDAVEMGPLPQELHTLKPGMHTIRLAGTDRYAPLEKNVTVSLNEVQDLGDQTLKVLKGKATITLGTTGAKVSIVSGSDRREFPTLPIAVDLDTSKSWALEASKAGFADYHQVVSFDDGVAEKTFNIVLDPKTVAFAAAAAPAPPPAAAAPAPRAPAFVAHAAPKEKDTSASDDSSGSSASSVGEGYLNINSLPASQVMLDGKLLGNTPKVHVPVSAGSHTVVFTNNDQGLKKQISVSVGAGETKPAIARLRE